MRRGRFFPCFSRSVALVAAGAGLAMVGCANTGAAADAELQLDPYYAAMDQSQPGTLLALGAGDRLGVELQRVDVMLAQREQQPGEPAPAAAVLTTVPVGVD